MPVVSAVLMCHAPIVIPSIAGGRAAACAASTAAMARAAQTLVDAQPEVLVCLSPHTPRLQRAFGVVDHGARGDFARFGAPGVTVDLPPADVGPAVVAEAGSLGEPIAPAELDHGAAVPLWFVQQAGFAGPTLLVALPWRATKDDHLTFGQALARAAQSDGRRWAILASGDMSHCLKPGAPSGHHPDGARFDAAFVDALGQTDLPVALRGLHDLRAHAAEDVVDTTLVACGALGQPGPAELFSYEGPFGVGYGIADLAPSG